MWNKEKKERFEVLRKERDQINENILTVKVEIAQIRTKISSAQNEKLRLENEEGRLNSLLVSIDEQIAKK